MTDARSNIIPFGVYIAIESPNEKTMQEKLEVWQKAFETFEKDIPAARRALEQRFREILGSPNEENQEIVSIVPAA